MTADMISRTEVYSYRMEIDLVEEPTSSAVGLWHNNRIISAKGLSKPDPAI
jgi:hypothetical protein